MSDQQIKDMTQDESKKTTALAITETTEIDQTFQNANDFRQIWEKITAPIDSILSETAKIIDKDPIMNISGELEKMNKEVQWVYKDIIDNDWAIMKFFKGIPLLGNLAKSIDAKIDETSFNVKSIEWKIEIIFSGFDQAYSSLNTSIDMQKLFLDGIEANLDKIIAYKDYIWTKIEEFSTRLEETTDEDDKNKLSMFIRNVEFFQSNLVVLIGNLEMSKKRLLMRLDSANKLSLAMNSSRPIFKTLLSTAIQETSSQKAIEASMKAMNAMGQTIDNMTTELTDKAIDSSKRAEELSSKPVLSSSKFIENVTKLKNHFDEIEDFRARIKTEAQEERKLFEEAKTKLENIKLLNKSDMDELNKQLIES